jgi:hypothetical protein
MLIMVSHHKKSSINTKQEGYRTFPVSMPLSGARDECTEEKREKQSRFDGNIGKIMKNGA